MYDPPFERPETWILNIFGITALILSLLYRIPQIYRIYKSKSAIDISIWMVTIQNISYIFYIIYGVLVWDWIYISTSIISVLQNITILILRCYYIRANKVDNDKPHLVRSNSIYVGINRKHKKEGP